MNAPSLSVAWSMITMPRAGYVAAYKPAAAAAME
jgi:hypothetical protein